MSNARRAIGLDIGGTKIAGAVVAEDGSMLAELTEPTPDVSDAATMTALLLEMVEKLRAQHPDVVAIGVGAAGTVEWPTGRIRWAPNNAYRDWEIRAELESATGLPAVVDNDANVAGLAEARLGDTRWSDMILVTVGTGVGSGIVLGGKIYRGPHGLGAELGHIIVNPDGPRCGCGNYGCLEAYASGTALTHMGRESAADDPDGLIATLAREAGVEVTGQTVTKAALQGDLAAQELFGRLGRWLGVGIASMTTIFELEAVVIGGGLVHTGDLLLGPTRLAAREFAYALEARPLVPVVPGTFGSDAGKIGAALLALDHA
ncbi:MAG: Glucokinase [Pseudonocardia sp.]|uniref:ROK family protein n=1 Tax=Pseudonocardia sp. TaxID=60912 RepID=UPI00261A45AA|nr:ROK family protein [Pseudonocardia sp.]MCU1628171.1 Glucokinase [Pseudonocardia sp.]